jgi:hypothetical protein
MTQDRGGSVYFEPLGAGVVKMTVYGKRRVGTGDYAGVELILDADDLEELELDLHKAQRAK